MEEITSYKSQFFDDDGNPIHKLSYCAFLDVLGFSALISESFEQGKENELLKNFHAEISKRIETMNSDSENSLIFFKSFTDNIVIAHPQFSPDLESEFGFILWSITKLQYQMALKAFFIRGGLSCSALFMDENSVYGPALIESYKLESKIAVNPLVVLSDDVKKLVLHHVNYYSSIKESPQNQDIWVNTDGNFFINYLSESIIDTGDSLEIDWDSLNIHKANIEENLDKYYSEPTIFSKYVWLASYHNQFCSSVKRYSGYKSSVKISTKKYKVKFSRLSDKNF